MRHNDKILKLALIFVFGGIFIYYFSHNPLQTSIFAPCPFYYFTGFFCPGCGSQRALHLLLEGNLWGAFRFNPLLVLTLPILVYGLGITAANWIFGTHYRFMLFYGKLFIFGYFGLAIIYWVIRNLPYYPFTVLAPPS